MSLSGTYTTFRRVLRRWVRNPAFIGSVILALGLAIIANLTAMSILSATILRKPPVKQPDSLVVAIEHTKSNVLALDSVRSSRYMAWRASSVFESSAALRVDFSTMLWNHSSRRISAAKVTPGFFRVLGVSPALGRVFEGSSSETPSIVLSHRLWMGEFGGDRGVLGQTILLEGRGYIVVGVMPAEFRIVYFDPEAWVPFPNSTWEHASSDAPGLRVLARLAPGVNLSQVGQAIAEISRSLSTEEGHEEIDARPLVMTLQDYIIKAAAIKPVVGVLMVSVLLVLVIACINVSHLLFVRASARKGELAIELSLGAPRTRLIAEMVYESVLIAIVSIALGILGSMYSIRQLQSKLTFNDYVSAVHLRVDVPTLWFCLGITLLLVSLMSLIPGMYFRSLQIDQVLKEGGRSGMGSRAMLRARGVLVTVQALSASLLLIIASAMIVRFVVAIRSSIGFEPSNVIITRLTLDQFKDVDQRTLFVQELLERLRGQRGIQSAAAANSLPMLDGGSIQMDTGSGTEWRRVSSRMVSPDFFTTLRIPILQGADFPVSASGLNRMIIVNQAFASRFLDGHEFDRIVRLRANDSSPAYAYRVVAVVGNTKHWFGEPGDGPDLYLRYSESPPVGTVLVLRSSLDPESVTHMIRRVVSGLEASQPIDAITTYQNALELHDSDETLLLTILIFIAVVAIALSCLGIYGVLSYTTELRRREFGLRLAFGSTPFGLACQVFKRNALLIAIGVAYGLIFTPVLVHLLDNIFPGRITHIGDIILIVLIVEVFSILAATWAPARQAARTDPLELLRSM